jgi:hypothetical protein
MLAGIKVWQSRNQDRTREVFAMASIRKKSSVILLLAGLLGLTAFSSESQKPGPAGTAGVIQTQETNSQGVVADLTECKRKDGVLTVKLGFRNTSGGTVTFYTSRLDDYDKVYVAADNKKYFILRDSEKEPLSGKTDGNVSLNPGQSWHWWAKFPAPPATVKSINLLTPVASPFDDVPISDQ